MLGAGESNKFLDSNVLVCGTMVCPSSTPTRHTSTGMLLGAGHRDRTATQSTPSGQSMLVRSSTAHGGELSRHGDSAQSHAQDIVFVCERPGKPRDT